MRYLAVMHKTETGYSASAPDVLGCVAAGDTPKETASLLREALELHLRGDALPEPTARAVEVNGYNVVIRKTDNGYRAEPHDLWPFMVAADTPERAESLMREVLPGYLADLRDNETPAPEPSSHVVYVDVTLPVPA